MCYWLTQTYCLYFKKTIYYQFHQNVCRFSVFAALSVTTIIGRAVIRNSSQQTVFQKRHAMPTQFIFSMCDNSSNHSLICQNDLHGLHICLFSIDLSWMFLATAVWTHWAVSFSLRVFVLVVHFRNWKIPYIYFYVPRNSTLCLSIYLCKFTFFVVSQETFSVINHHWPRSGIKRPVCWTFSNWLLNNLMH